MPGRIDVFNPDAKARFAKVAHGAVNGFLVNSGCLATGEAHFRRCQKPLRDGDVDEALLKAGHCEPAAWSFHADVAEISRIYSDQNGLVGACDRDITEVSNVVWISASRNQRLG